MKRSFLRRHQLSKQDAYLLAHVVANFRDGGSEEEIAASIGWPVKRVRKSMRNCARFGFVDGPEAARLRGEVVATGGPKIGINDLLSHDETQKAKGGK